MTTDTEMKRPSDNRKTQRPDRQSKAIAGEAFRNLTQALEDALAFELGERKDLRVTRIRGFRPPKASTQDTGR